MAPQATSGLSEALADPLSDTLEAWARDLIAKCPYWFADVRIWGAEPFAIWFEAKRAGASESKAWTALLREQRGVTLVKRVESGWPVLDEGDSTTEEVG